MKESSQLQHPDNNLLIRIHSEGISYVITDENDEVVLQQLINVPAGKLNEVQFFEHFFEQPELRVSDENVLIVFENSHYKLIPNELFRQSDFNEFFELEFGKNEKTKLLYNLLPQWGAHLVFEVQEPLMNFFDKKYPEAEVDHHLFKLLKQDVKRNSNAAFVYLRKDFVDLIVVNDNSLLLANAFQTKTNEDICYFVLNVYEQLGLDTETFALKILFENSADSGLVALLKQYVMKLEVIS